jgi:hypothetical protein
VFDDYFETVHHKGPDPPPVWEDLILKSRFRNDIEGDVEDTWETTPTTDAVTTPSTKLPQQPDNGEIDPSPLPDVPRPSSDEKSPRTMTVPSPVTKESPSLSREPPKPLSPAPTAAPTEAEPSSSGPRRSSRVRKPVDHFKFNKSHGYTTVQHYLSRIVKCISVFSAHRDVYATHYAIALALDPTFGVLDGLSSLSPDFLATHPWMFKSKKGCDPDTPTIREALTGPYHNEFIEAMAIEIDELESHGTWTITNRSNIPSNAQVIPLTWAYKVKRWPSGEMRKIKARICVRGDLQTEGVDAFGTYSPVAS